MPIFIIYVPAVMHAMIVIQDQNVHSVEFTHA